jgi:hypothetical protein
MVFFKQGLIIAVIAAFQMARAAPEQSGALSSIGISVNENPVINKDNVTIPESSHVAINGGDKNEKIEPPSHLDQTGKKKWLLPSAKAATITGFAALCAMAYFLHQQNEYGSLYRIAKSQNMRQENYENQKTFSQNAILSGITGGVMLSTGGVLFIWNYNRTKVKNIAVSPIIGRETGIMAMVDF